MDDSAVVKIVPIDVPVVHEQEASEDSASHSGGAPQTSKSGHNHQGNGVGTISDKITTEEVVSFENLSTERVRIVMPAHTGPSGHAMKTKLKTKSHTGLRLSIGSMGKRHTLRSICSMKVLRHNVRAYIDEMRESGTIPALSPNGAFMAIWRPLIFSCTVYAVVMAPFDVVFAWWKQPSAYKVFGKMLDVIFMFDIILNFNVAFIHHGELIVDHWEIALHYAKSYFFIDLVSNIPYDWFAGGVGKSRKIVKFLKFPKIIRFVKLLRVLKEQTQYVGVMSTVGGAVLVAHYYSCLWNYILFDSCEIGTVKPCPRVADAYLEGFSLSISGLAGTDSWTRLLGLSGTSVLGTNLNPGEPLAPMMEFAASSMVLIGLLMVAALFANVASTVFAASENGRQRSRTLSRRKEEMKAFEIPQLLQDKVAMTYEHLWRYGDERDGMLRDPILSLDLRRELALCTHGYALRQVPLFRSMTNDVMKCLAQKVDIRLYTPGDMIVLKGEVGKELFILCTGTAVPLASDGSVLRNIELGPGDFFGEICFLHPGSRRSASIKAEEFCRAMVLTIKVFAELDLLDEVQQLSKEAKHMREAYVRASALTSASPSDHVTGFNTQTTGISRVSTTSSRIITPATGLSSERSLLTSESFQSGGPGARHGTLTSETTPRGTLKSQGGTPCQGGVRTVGAFLPMPGTPTQGASRIAPSHFGLAPHPFSINSAGNNAASTKESDRQDGRATLDTDLYELDDGLPFHVEPTVPIVYEAVHRLAEMVESGQRTQDHNFRECNERLSALERRMERMQDAVEHVSKCLNEAPRTAGLNEASRTSVLNEAPRTSGVSHKQSVLQ